MDWGWIACGVVVVLVFLRDSFWKPYLKGYAEEKGKRLATHEDIENVLRELKLVTKETESIKAQVSGDLWKQQWKLERKREVYAKLLASLNQLAIDIQKCDAFAEHARNEPALESGHNDALKARIETEAKLQLAIAEAWLFVEHKEAKKTIFRQLSFLFYEEAVKGQIQNTLLQVIPTVVKVGREDLGIDDTVGPTA